MSQRDGDRTYLLVPAIADSIPPRIPVYVGQSSRLLRELEEAVQTDVLWAAVAGRSDLIEQNIRGFLFFGSGGSLCF
jgi:hypothetical protein